MDKEIKIVKITDDTCVAFGKIKGMGVASMMLNCKGKSHREIERDYQGRFATQFHHRKELDDSLMNMGRGRWLFSWYDFDDVAKTHIVKENVMGKVMSEKPKVYYLVKKPEGGFETKKIESRLYDEDELEQMFGIK